MSKRKISVFFIFFLYTILLRNTTQAQLIGVELEPGRIDTLFELFALIRFDLCQGECYQFHYIESANRAPDFDYFEDSIYWTFKLGIHSTSRERNPYVCFPNLAGPDTIQMQQRIYNNIIKKWGYSGQGHKENYVIKCPPEAIFDADRYIVCVGETVTFSDSSRLVPDEWYWEFEGGEPSGYEGLEPPPIRYDVPGIYTARLRVSNSAGDDEMVKTSLIDVRDGPQQVGDRITEIREDFGEQVNLSPCSLGDIYTWTPEIGLSCADCPSPELLIGHTDRYMLTVQLEGQDCIDTCEYHILAQEVEETIWFPTAFTPNGDGVNDFFEGYGNHVEIEELRIFDRWGNLLYSRRGSEARWDGQAKGTPVNPGAYAFYAIYRKLYTQETDIISGEVSVFR